MAFKIIIQKLLIFLILLTTTGFPFKILHKTVSPRLVNFIALILCILVYSFWCKDLKKIRISKVSIIPFLIAIFGLIRPGILPPPEFQIYDGWLFCLGMTLLLNESQLRSLFKFTTILLLPIALFSLYTVPPSIYQSSLLILGGGTLSIFLPKLKQLPKPTECMVAGVLGIIGFTLLSLQFLVFDPGVRKAGKIAFDIGHKSTEAPQGVYTTNLNESLQHGHGNLVEFLRKFGYRVSFLSSPLSKDNLKGQDILVLIMESNIYNTEEVKSVVEWVKEGGGLFVISDHTNIDNTMSSLNPIIENFGIRLRFDTIWLLTTERGDLIYARDPLVWDMLRVSPSVGASLDLEKGAKSVVKTSYDAYSDTGNPYNYQMAYLGNSQLDKDEKIGDLILAASSKYGKGRVLVLSDSAYFQNTALYRSYDFAHRIFDWLNKKNSPGYDFLWLSLPFLLILIVYLVLTQGRILLTVPYSFGISIVIAIIISTNLNMRFYPAPDFNLLGKKRVLFDIAHNNEYTTYWTKRAHSETGIDSLIQQVERVGLYPFVKERGRITLKELSEYSIYIVVAPNTKYSRSEINSIKDYVSQGGSLLVVEGPRKWRILDDMLEVFSLKLDKFPLGMSEPVRMMENLALRVPYENFYASMVSSPITENVNYIRFVNPCKIEGGEKIATVNEVPVLVTKDYGKGKIVLVGDDRFFANYISENKKGIVDEVKIRITWNIIRYLMKE